MKTLIPIFLTHLLGLLSPGADFFMVIKNALQYSRKKGIFTAIGFGFGILVHLSYCVFGLHFILKYDFIFLIIKILGALYLCYLGGKSFFTKTQNIHFKNQKTQNTISNFQAVKIGFLTNLLNPKATLFFLGIFSFVLNANISRLKIFILCGFIFLTTILWFSLVSVFFTQTQIRTQFLKREWIFNKILGIILMGIAIKMLFFS